jgi:hypothetical protein
MYSFFHILPEQYYLQDYCETRLERQADRTSAD